MLAWRLVKRNSASQLLPAHHTQRLHCAQVLETMPQGEYKTVQMQKVGYKIKVMFQYTLERASPLVVALVVGIDALPYVSQCKAK